MSRRTTILGRGGTVLIAISLALLLVSLIPKINLVTYEGNMPVSPEQVQTTNSQVLNPQQGFQVKVTVEGTINAYLLEVGKEPYAEAANETEMQASTIITSSRSVMYEPLFANATELQEFLDANPNLVIWEYNLEDESFERYYVPTKVMNATLVFYNPSSDRVTVDYEVTLTSTVAPGEKVRNIAFWTTPIGIILALPWLVNIWKQRKQK